MRNASDKNCMENQNTHFMYSDVFSKAMPCVRWCGKCGRSRLATDNTIL